MDLRKHLRSTVIASSGIGIGLIIGIHWENRTFHITKELVHPNAKSHTQKSTDFFQKIRNLEIRVEERNKQALTVDDLESLLYDTPIEEIQKYSSVREEREAKERYGRLFVTQDWNDKESKKRFSQWARNSLRPLIAEFTNKPWPLDKKGEREGLCYRSHMSVQLPDTDSHWIIVGSFDTFASGRSPMETMQLDPLMSGPFFRVLSEDRSLPSTHYFSTGQQLMTSFWKEGIPYLHGRHQWVEPKFTDDIEDLALPMPWSGSTDGYLYRRSQKKWQPISIEPWVRISCSESRALLKQYQADYNTPEEEISEQSL